MTSPRVATDTPTFGCTSLRADSEQLQTLSTADSAEAQRLQLALVYRVAHKRILARHLRRVLFALALLDRPLPQSKKQWVRALGEAADSLNSSGYSQSLAAAHCIDMYMCVCVYVCVCVCV